MNANIFRTNLFRSTGFALALAVCGGPLRAQEQNPPRYTVKDLGPVGGPPGQPLVLKNDGRISGAVAVADGAENAVLWLNGVIADIGNPGLKGRNSVAFGVNEIGQAVGEAETAASDPNDEDFCGFQALGFSSSAITCSPFLWQNGVMTPLRTLGGANGAANQINNQGVAAGVAENTTLDAGCPGPQKFQFKPVTWQHDQVHELSTYGDPDGIAFAINDAGQVVGASGQCTTFNPVNFVYLFPIHALLWQKGTATDLGTLGGSFGNIAINLNNRGQVVGSSDLYRDTTFHGFLWTQVSGMQDLGTVQGDAASAALAINDGGVVVGVSLDTNFNPRAFVRQNGSLLDLNELIAGDSSLYLLTACSINAQGQIIGLAFDPNSNDLHGYLATPSSSAAAAAGLSETKARATSLPMDVHMLVERLRFGRFGMRPPGPH
jgi:probable HAF family extracellular repeat protein